MPSFCSLPDEIIKNSICSHFAFFPPDPAALAFRAVAKRFVSMVPLNDILSIDKKSAKWLTNGAPLVWEEHMNTDALSCIRFRTMLYLSHEHIEDIKHPHIHRRIFSIEPTERVNVIVVARRERIQMVYQNSLTHTDDEINLGISAVAACRFFQEVFFVLADGTLLRTRITSSQEETFKLFQTMTSGPKKKISFHDESTDEDKCYSCKSMQTSDGENFLFLNYEGKLDFVNWSGSDKSETIATSVESFQLFGNLAVFMTEEGKLKLVCLKFKEQSAEYFIVSMETEMAQVFIVVPSIHHLWIVSKNEQIIKYEMPSLQSDNKDTPQTKKE